MTAREPRAWSPGAARRRRPAPLLLLACGLLALAAAGCGPRPPGTATPPSPPPADADRDRPVRRSGAASHRLTHVVAPGETLAKLAETYYGDPARARDLADDNRLDAAGRLAVGANLDVRFTEDEWQGYEARSAALAPYNRGVDELTAGELEKAEATLRQAVDLAPEFAPARYNLALVWMKRGRYEQAEQALAALLAQRPRDRDFLYAHGNVLFHQARFDQAAAEFRKLLEIVPGHRPGSFGLARSLQEAGRKAEAIAAWEAYLRLDATSDWAAEARRALAKLRGG